MRICRIDVDRFLTFDHLQLEVDHSLQVIAGPNNSGKSSLITLLEAFFSDPDDGDLLNLAPLHKYYSALGPRTLSQIQIWFADLSAQEHKTFGSIVRNDGRMWISLRSSKKGKISYIASRDSNADDSRAYYLELLKSFHFVKIPSVRVGSSTGRGDRDSLDRLLDVLEAVLIRQGSTRSTNLQQEYRKAFAPVEDLVQTVLDESANAIAKDLPFQESKVKFELPEPRYALRGMLEASIIRSSGDISVPVAERGTGFQSALVLGILRHVADRESAKSTNLLFCLEEPEAFLHPQTQRAMSSIIADVANKAQMLVTTHSAIVVDSFEIGRIARLPLRVGGTRHTWKPPRLEPAIAGRLTRYCTAANSELIFSNAVIFVEGESDKMVLELILDELCTQAGGHYALGLTVIDAGGITKIRSLLELAEMFEVQSYVLADMDGLTKASGKRELLDVLLSRRQGLSDYERTEVRNHADRSVDKLSSATMRQFRINRVLRPHGAYVLASDLEGLFLESLGTDGLVSALLTESAITKHFAEEILVQEEGESYEALAKWLGSKGWDSTRRPSGKLQPHLSIPLMKNCLALENRPAGLRRLVLWLQEVVSRASAAAL